MHSTKETETTRSIIDRFNEAFNQHDVDAIMALMTDEIVFENTGPAPKGSRHVGQAEVRQFWEDLFTESPNAVFEVEDVFVGDDRCAVTWCYTWDRSGGDADDPGYVRGVDLFRVRDGKVAEKLAYVKG